jgi:hypothetical protein
VVLFTPGEEAADQYTGYLTNRTITGLYAQEVKGAVVMIEREFFVSFPPSTTTGLIYVGKKTVTGETHHLIWS